MDYLKEYITSYLHNFSRFYLGMINLSPQTYLTSDPSTHADTDYHIRE